MKKCKDCVYFLSTSNINNCKAGIIGTANPEDSACYKIAQQNNKENNKLLY